VDREREVKEKPPSQNFLRRGGLDNSQGVAFRSEESFRCVNSETIGCEGLLLGVSVKNPETEVG
jgi:hypothetical protein